ncbi:LysR family transcriptional regulator [Paraburkholderia sp. BL6665CI2N2]|uniref:LysR family transcriptional regulator n=1 Tax=Paraburkholderia sp. BL6665CI2N2 TaxID=1938806 RepID=UPI00106570F5|nr:LysR family transcriptional regulator [Paraburkholderia sp. BL6665CI2N2]TDY16676.1 LysR family transcriptional regulator [Paraburkholderia sp. BL6665CI2N2]
MNLLASIRIFTRVAACLNFAEAAKQLGISNSVVTRSLATLEEHLGVRLVNRTTRRVSLTDTGRLYRERCIELLRQLDAMDECIAFAAEQPPRSLRIAASSLYATTDLPEVLASYRALEPRIRFELTVFDTMNDVVANEFDVCFSSERRLRDSSLVCRPLAQTRDIIVASPHYLARCPAPRTPADLALHGVLVASDAPSRYWEFRDAHGTQRIVVDPIMNVQSPQVVKRAVQAGLGIARLSRSFVRDELANGSLLELLDDSPLCGDERTVWLLYSGQRHMAIALRSFVDFVVEHYRQRPAVSKLKNDLCVDNTPQQTSNTELLSARIL